MTYQLTPDGAKQLRGAVVRGGQKVPAGVLASLIWSAHDLVFDTGQVTAAVGQTAQSRRHSPLLFQPIQTALPLLVAPVPQIGVRQPIRYGPEALFSNSDNPQ